MFHDTLVTAISRHSAYARKAHADVFANLFDLMQFSAHLLHKLRYRCVSVDQGWAAAEAPDCDLRIGKVFCSIAERMIVFLRCALDYKANKKMVDMKKHSKGFVRYNEVNTRGGSCHSVPAQQTDWSRNYWQERKHASLI